MPQTLHPCSGIHIQYNLTFLQSFCGHHNFNKEHSLGIIISTINAFSVHHMLHVTWIPSQATEVLTSVATTLAVKTVLPQHWVSKLSPWFDNNVNRNRAYIVMTSLQSHSHFLLIMHLSLMYTTSNILFISYEVKINN